MAKRNPGGGYRSDDSGSEYEPADESAASVFGEPARPRPPHPGGRPGPAGGWPPPPTAPAYPGPAERPTTVWSPTPGQYRPPPTQAYAPVDPAGAGYGYAPEWDAPAGQPPAGPGRRPPSRPPARPAGGDRSDRSPREGGSGLPFGLGALLGVAGLGCFLASLFVLPWFEIGGSAVTLEDLRSAFTVAETDPDALPGAADEPAAGVTEGIPSPDEVGEVVEQEARARAAEVVAGAIDSGKSRYLELYTDVLWLVLAGAVALAVLFSTILSPRSFALSLLLGFRRLSGAVTVLAGMAHGAALWIVFTRAGAPTPAPGVWVGVGGLAAVLLACIVGPKK